MFLDKNTPYIFTIENIFNADECKTLISYIENNNPLPAPINTTFGEKHKPDVRNNDRVMLKSLELAEKIYNKIKKKLPQKIFDHKLCGLNELFRCYRYKPGMRFAPHSDGAFQRNEFERSFYTFLIYLNEVQAGGETQFLVEPELSFRPEAGLGLLFQHPIVHEGCEVTSGVKYVIRTDIMYLKSSSDNIQDEASLSIKRHINRTQRN